MWSRELQFSLSRFLQSPSNLALVFFGMSSVLLLASLLLAYALVQTTRYVPAPNQLIFPPVFVFSSLLLAAGSRSLHQATWHVRREQQTPFRKHLTTALLEGTSFVGMQFYGLWCLLLNRGETAEAIGLQDGAFAFALMHGVHFVVALLFLVFIWLRAMADRYDHEYSFGVTFCAWFWHALGIAWLAIMVAFLLASTVVV